MSHVVAVGIANKLEPRTHRNKKQLIELNLKNLKNVFLG